MLIDKYLPAYQFNEFHSVELNGFVDDIYQKMLQCDFSNSSLIKLLFRIRGMSKEVYSIEHLTKMGFIKLDEEPGKEILFGMVTDNPMFNTCRSNVSSKEFMQKDDDGIIKAVINFKLHDKSNSQHIISTETRVWCGGKQLKSQFKKYWFFVKPFSQLIRRSMLKQMKQQILNSTTEPVCTP
ncbi:hypothetical protein FRZ67_02075 [Panacibacter ginsenosidivorans]|uniref:DUF2867 domain-containing protein n=1 Tax=Panacibacter ginsenosidivorans TaxID=1813871 RepID=A0A5B8V424_9BACT|nr:hypothetical protein [Panacibacter ginsenosidivorans]QEC66150.1 hypothetical protein FRZ67_02075 [Panacibacter ginsenosidivorans]